MLKLLQKKLISINVISLMLVTVVSFSWVFFTFRATIIKEAEKAIDRALDGYSNARTVFVPDIPSAEDFSVTVEIYESPPRDKNIIFKTRILPDGTEIIAKCDITEENRLLHNLMTTLFASGGTITLLIFIISLSVSKKAIKPIAESIEIQNRFIADISHELKTPLSAITANLELIHPTRKQERWIDNIRFETDRMIRLIGNMLGLFSKSNKTEFSIISLSEICKSSVLSFEAVAYEKGIEFITDIKDGVFIYGNREQAEQLVYILLDNAVKYNYPGGFVKISLKTKHLKALLTVENTGEPITDSSAVFRRFYRGDESRSSTGFGLGLSIAYKIVSDHGGKIWVKWKTNIFSVNLGLKK